MTTEPTPAHGASDSVTATPPAAPPSDATSTAIAEQPAPTPPAPASPAAPTPTAPTIAKEPGPDLSLRIDYLLLAILLVLSFLLASFTASNSDLWTHLATGRLISEGKFEFGVDPFTWTTEQTENAPAVPWIHQSWLFSLLVFQIHESLGGAGLVVIKAILFTLTIGVLSRIGWQSPNRWFLLICLLMATLAASQRALMQPIVVSMLFLAITIYLLYRGGVFALTIAEQQPADTRCLWCLPPLFALWANLDVWFILGPIILGLVWTAAGLARWFGGGQGVPGKTLGIVFGAGVLACLLNPYHVHVFQLPPELAYFVLAIADPLRIPMPAELVAGGRSLKELRSINADVAWTLSSVDADYWWRTQFGKNVAGLAFYPLALLGLMTFVMAALVKSSKGAPSLQFARFLIWLVFAVLALSLYRMIPFFVLIAAPLTAMTLDEFLLWQQKTADIPKERRDRGIKMARIVSVPFFLLMIGLAWPGWLHGAGDYSSRRRVAWQTRPEPSLQKAAEAMQAVKSAGEGNNAFNVDFELGNLMPWFAPDVKYCMDSRFSLYAGKAPAFGKLRDAINSGKADADWQAAFAAHQISQLAFPLGNSQESLARLRGMWSEPDEWRHRHGDTRMAVLTWAGPKRHWPDSAVNDDANRLAFGDVPEALRPPPRGTPTPTPLNEWTKYIDGVGPTPVGLGEIVLAQERFNVAGAVVHAHAWRPAWVASLASLPSLQGVPGGMNLHACLITKSLATLITIQGREAGPPAIPVLMVRTARRGVAENPLDFRSHLALMNTLEFLRREQEDRWINHRAGWEHPAPLRDRIRQLQQVVGLYNAVRLRPEDPGLHDTLAKHYLKLQIFDLALEHMQLAEKAMIDARAQEPSGNLKQFDDQLKAYHQELESLESNVKQRIAKWKETPAGASAFQKAVTAQHGSFLMIVGDRRIDTKLGLARKAINTLATIKEGSMAPNEEVPYLHFRLDLLCAIGDIEVLQRDLNDERVKKMLAPESYAQYQLLAAAAVGDYETMDSAIVAIEKVVREAAKFDQAQTALATAMMAGFAQPLCPDSPAVVVGRAIPALMVANTFGVQQQARRGEIANALALRGMLLLEAGDTKKAREVFQQAMTEGEGALFFTERPIARRYLELLNANLPR